MYVFTLLTGMILKHKCQYTFEVCFSTFLEVSLVQVPVYFLRIHPHTLEV